MYLQQGRGCWPQEMASFGLPSSRCVLCIRGGAHTGPAETCGDCAKASSPWLEANDSNACAPVLRLQGRWRTTRHTALATRRPRRPGCWGRPGGTCCCRTCSRCGRGLLPQCSAGPPLGGASWPALGPGAAGRRPGGWRCVWVARKRSTCVVGAAGALCCVVLGGGLALVCQGEDRGGNPDLVIK